MRLFEAVIERKFNSKKRRRKDERLGTHAEYNGCLLSFLNNLKLCFNSLATC